jgi:hypothetical protein
LPVWLRPDVCSSGQRRARVGLLGFPVPIKGQPDLGAGTKSPSIPGIVPLRCDFPSLEAPATAGALCPAGGYVPRPDRSASDSLAPKTKTVAAPGKLQTMAEHLHYGRGTWFVGTRHCFHRFDQILKPNGRGIGARYGGTAHQRLRYASQAWATNMPMLKMTPTAVTTSVMPLLPGSGLRCREGRPE